MNIGDLVFVGFNSRIAALNRETGELVWEWKAPKGTGYVVVLVDGDRLYASIYGYTYCLDPMTGTVLWFNELAGFGLGVPSLATANAAVMALQAIAADEEQRRRSSSTSGEGGCNVEARAQLTCRPSLRS